MVIENSVSGAKEQDCLREFGRLLRAGQPHVARRMYYALYNGEGDFPSTRALYCALGQDAIREFCWRKQYERAERIARAFEDWNFEAYLEAFHPRYAKQKLIKPKGDKKTGEKHARF